VKNHLCAILKIAKKPLRPMDIWLTIKCDMKILRLFNVSIAEISLEEKIL